MDLSTIERVKTIIGEEGTSQDAFLSQIVSAVSRRAEAYMMRHVEQVERTEVYTMRRYEKLLLLRGAPIDRLDSAGRAMTPFVAKESWQREWTNEPALSIGSEILVDEERGTIRFLYDFVIATDAAGRPVSPTSVQVTYTGGMAVDTDAFVQAYPDVAQAVDLQVAYLFRRRENPGGSTHLGGSSAVYERPYELMPETRRALDLYRRRIVA